MGILNFLKNNFGSSENANDSTYQSIIDSAYKEMMQSDQQYWWSLKVNEIKTYGEKLLPLSDKQKVAFIVSAVKDIHQYHNNRNSYSSEDKGYKTSNITDDFMRNVLKSKLVFDDTDIEEIFQAFKNHDKYGSSTNILYWPLNLLINQIEKNVKEKAASEKLNATLQQIKAVLKDQAQIYQEKEQLKIIEKIDLILFKSDDTNIGVKPTFFLGKDEFGEYANDYIKKMNDGDRQNWFKLMQHAQKATAGKPSNKFVEESRTLYKAYSADKFKVQVNDWFLFLISMKEKTEQHTTEHYTYTTSEFISSPNTDIIKGFIWSCVHFHDKNTLFNIAKLAERSYRKIPNKGPAAASIGNACLYVLANSKGLDGVGHLSRLKLRIKQSSTQNLIEKYLQDAATSQGVSIHEIEDMAVDDYGLLNGKKTYEFDGFKAELIITGVGKTALNWYKPDGSPQKAIPSAVKEKYAIKLKKIKDTIKQVELTVGAQRDRLDRMFKSNRSIVGTNFDEFYFSHGLMSYLAYNIIWTVERAGKKEAIFYLNEKWCNSKGECIEIIIDESTTFSLWHPVFYSVAEIKQWREFMMEHKIVQPLKQAYRELYLLTDAEINTVTYSNRMAAHILKQHQFNSLAKIRGWKYSLMGCFDNGVDSDYASTELKEYNLRAEFWINEINADDSYNDTGIWLYIATDQVRFTDTTTGNVKQLIEIPPIVLSEIMRDVDLFVGVASVGNDPNWQDGGGLRGYNNYWQSYSFGDLNEVAKTRKTILEGLLPRLKIGKVSTIKDKFLVVQGSLRTYKIHLGSTNILMEPNDQYLCIVADRGKKDTSENIFLPFEGDNGLSIILSKAMLLAKDEKITDSTITSQIKLK
jgi:Domain of unknown function (DUF4132)